MWEFLHLLLHYAQGFVNSITQLNISHMSLIDTPITLIYNFSRVTLHENFSHVLN